MYYAQNPIGIGRLAMAMILLGYDFETILTEIDKEFPQNRTNRKCLSWYAWLLRKQGASVPYFWCDARR